MSLMAAPVGDVMTPICRGSVGRARLCAGSKKSLGREFLFQFLELSPQKPLAGRLEVFDDELVAATRFVDRDPGPGDDLHPILERKFHRTVRAAKHCAADLCLFVLQREIEVSRSGAGQV